MESTPRIEELDSHPYVAARSEVTPETFRSVVDSSFGKPFGWLVEQGIPPAGAPFIRYLRIDAGGQPAEIEMGVPVATPVDPPEGLVTGEMPAGSYLVHVHEGPYTHAELDDLIDAQVLLRDYARDNALETEVHRTKDGLEVTASAEYYEIGPPMEEDFTKWRTRIVQLLA